MYSSCCRYYPHIWGMYIYLQQQYEVHYGEIYRVNENLKTPVEEEFEDNKAAYFKALDDYNAQLEKREAYEKMVAEGTACKAINIDNLEPEYGYVAVVKSDPNGEELIHDDGGDAADGSHIPDSVAGSKKKTSGNLTDTLLNKDRKNRETALCKVIDDVKKMLKNTEIAPVDITPMEDDLIHYIMLRNLDIRHYEMFGLDDQGSLSDDEQMQPYTRTEKRLKT